MYRTKSFVEPNVSAKTKTFGKLFPCENSRNVRFLNIFSFENLFIFHPFFCISCCLLSCASVLYVYLVVVVVLNSYSRIQIIIMHKRREFPRKSIYLYCWPIILTKRILFVLRTQCTFYFLLLRTYISFLMNLISFLTVLSFYQCTNVFIYCYQCILLRLLHFWINIILSVLFCVLIFSRKR